MPRCYMVKKNLTKITDGEFEGKTPGPKSPTEATTAPTSPAYYENSDVTVTMTNGKYIRSIHTYVLVLL